VLPPDVEPPEEPPPLQPSDGQQPQNPPIGVQVRSGDQHLPPHWSPFIAQKIGGEEEEDKDEGKKEEEEEEEQRPKSKCRQSEGGIQMSVVQTSLSLQSALLVQREEEEKD
tara:strand:+ start:260 stop:592 length:333 start_codon:yes stop_codon:yes gene_type:complete